MLHARWCRLADPRPLVLDRAALRARHELRLLRRRRRWPHARLRWYRARHGGAAIALTDGRALAAVIPTPWIAIGQASRNDALGTRADDGLLDA